MTHPPRIRLTGRATRFLALLQDFGHISERQLDELFVALVETYGREREALVDLPAVRRVAAVILFNGSPEAESEVLAEDWPLLFS